MRSESRYQFLFLRRRETTVASDTYEMDDELEKYLERRELALVATLLCPVAFVFWESGLSEYQNKGAPLTLFLLGLSASSPDESFLASVKKWKAA